MSIHEECKTSEEWAKYFALAAKEGVYDQETKVLYKFTKVLLPYAAPTKLHIKSRYQLYQAPTRSTLSKIGAALESVEVRTPGNAVHIMYNDTLYTLGYWESWSRGCVPRRVRSQGNAYDYVERRSKKIIKKRREKLGDLSEWRIFAEGHFPRPGVYGQTRFIAVRRV